MSTIYSNNNKKRDETSMSAQKTTRYTIWESNPDFTKEDKDFLKSEYPDSSDTELFEIFQENNQFHLDDEKANLGSIEPCNGILVVGFLGLWNGNRQALLNSPTPDNIADCLRLYSRDAYEQTFYVDEKGEFWCEEIHHDGTNRYWFRAWRPEITDIQKENLELQIYEGKECTAAIKRKTIRLGDFIGDVYGWKFPYRSRISRLEGYRIRGETQNKNT